MKILVTGGAGFIGSNLIRYILANTDHSVVNLDKLTYAGNLESLRDIENDSRYAFEQGDICDEEIVRKVFKTHAPESVMHLAAESHVDRSIDGPGEFIKTNVVGSFTMLHAARGHYESLEGASKRDFRYLHVSTDEVYGSLGMTDDAFHETTPYDPHSPYSASKAASDHLARAWRTTYGLPVLVTNCSNNYGAYQFPEKLIPVVILKAIRGEEIPVYGKGENVRDWLHVEDHANALVTVLENGKPGETYNIGGNNEQSNISVVKHICGILDRIHPIASNNRLQDGKPLSSYSDLITFVTDRPGHDLRYAINAEKMRTKLNWQPSESFDSGFEKTVQWYLDNEDWWQRCLSGEYKLQRQGNQ